MTRRKAFTLVEALAMLLMLGAILAATLQLFHTLARDAPSIAACVEVGRHVSRMLRRLGRDVDAARSLPQAVGDLEAGPARILIDHSGQVICYERQGESIVRRVLAPAGEEPAPPTVWRVPGAVVEWKLRRQAGRIVAIETCTHVRRRIGHQTVSNLANAHVFFVGAMGDGREVR